MKYKVGIYHMLRLRLVIQPRKGWTRTGVQGCYIAPNNWHPLWSMNKPTAFITRSGSWKRPELLPGGHYRGRGFETTVI